MDEKGLDLAETVWTRLDRKAGAIVELTVRQLRHRISTWVVLGVGTLLMVLLLAFYIDAVRDSFEPIDNDGDSVDEDSDGYPRGQEMKYGTSDFDSSDFPGVSEYVPESMIGFNEQQRELYGNKTWNGEALFEATWIDTELEGEWWEDRIIDWEEIDDCPDQDSAGSWFPQWGSACEYGDPDGDGLTSYYVRGEWRGEGLATVPEGSFLEWGHYTEPVYIEPDPSEMYIDEDGIDCFDSAGKRVDCPVSDRLGGSHGYDDDGDCYREGWAEGSNDDWFLEYDGDGERYDPDSNRNGIRCDVLWIVDADGNEVVSINADSFVDEDPDDEQYVGELSHRTFIIGVGKMAFVILLGLFIPLFLALGLVRDETENGTLHFLLSKPIHRGEFILYRLLGYLTVSGTYVLTLSLLVGIVTATLGPGDQLFRLTDLPVWLGIGISTIFVLAAYGALFNTMGLISPKYGVYICIIFGVWEFMMGTFSIINPNWAVSSISITHWALQMIDATVLMAWPDTLQWAEMGEAYGIDTGLNFFWHPPVHTFGTQSGAVALLVSSVTLLTVTALMIYIGQSVFSRREIS